MKPPQHRTLCACATPQLHLLCSRLPSAWQSQTQRGAVFPQIPSPQPPTRPRGCFKVRRGMFVPSRGGGSAARGIGQVRCIQSVEMCSGNSHAQSLCRRGGAWSLWVTALMDGSDGMNVAGGGGKGEKGEVRRLLSVAEAGERTRLRCIVDGVEVPPRVEVVGMMLRDCNTGSELQPMMDSDDATVDRAIEAAHRCHVRGDWRRLSVAERCEHLSRVSEFVASVEEEMAVADAINTGVVHDLTSVINGTLKGAFEEVAKSTEEAEMEVHFDGVYGDIEVARKPWGPTVILSPWNVPGGSVVPKVAAALAAGAPVILKPSEWAPNSLDILSRAIARCGLPRGVFQMVHGGARVGARLVDDPRIRCVNFTGSTESGRKVAVACAAQFKRCSCELGGNNAMVVLDDVGEPELVKAVAERIVQALTVLNGQWCAGLGRLLVARRVLPYLLDAVLARLAKVKIGSSMESGIEMGPLAFPAHLAHLKSIIDRYVGLGGVVHSSTRLPEGLGGNFMAPTLITGIDVEAAVDELFGPVCTVHAFDDEADAIRAVNMATGMLQCYVFTADEARGLAIAEEITCGLVMVNGVGFCFEAPSGGEPTFSYWGSAGIGDDGPLATILHSFCGRRVVGVNGSMATVASECSGEEGSASASKIASDEATDETPSEGKVEQQASTEALEHGRRRRSTDASGPLGYRGHHYEPLDIGVDGAHAGRRGDPGRHKYATGAGTAERKS